MEERIGQGERLFDLESPILDGLAADGFGHWLAGFIDGEGSFMLRMGDVNRRGTRTHLDMRCTISVRADEKPMLDEIRARTTVGRVRYCKPRGNANPLFRWDVSKHSDLITLVAIFDRFPLRAKKSRDYAIWREAVLAYIDLRRKPGAGAGGFDSSPFETAVIDLRSIRAFKEAA